MLDSQRAYDSTAEIYSHMILLPRGSSILKLCICLFAGLQWEYIVSNECSEVLSYLPLLPILGGVWFWVLKFNRYCSILFYLTIVSNHGLTKFKRFVSQITL